MTAGPRLVGVYGGSIAKLDLARVRRPGTTRSGNGLSPRLGTQNDDPTPLPLFGSPRTPSSSADLSPLTAEPATGSPRPVGHPG